LGILDIFHSTPSPDKFAKVVMDYLAKNGHTKPVRFVAREFQLKLDGGNRTFNLHNAYRDYCKASKAERANVLASYASVYVMEESTVPDTFAAARARLLPSIRGKGIVGMLSRMSRSNGLAASEAVYRPLSSDAVVMLAYDGEQSMQMLMASTLQKWGVSFEGAYAVALDNLRDATVAKFSRVASGLYVSNWNDSYDSARMLLPDVLHQLGLGATPVFMLPTRNRLLVASGSDRSAVAKMIDLAHQVVEEEGRAVSAKLYRLEGRASVEFVPDDAELASNLKLLELKFLADDYASQKADLEKFHQQKGLDIFVASFAAYKVNGQLTSMATWTKGVDTLLPKTDAITFVTLPEGNGQARTKVVRWDDAFAMLGRGMVLQDDYPPLYRVTGFPTEEALKRLPPLVPLAA
jgi:hypothetical protein